jgi:glycine/D-amino acid oxidase-like deaminating enzyme
MNKILLLFAHNEYLVHTQNYECLTVEVYPRPDGTIYICGIGGSDYITTEELKKGAFRGESCKPNEARVEAAKASFQTMSSVYKETGELDRAQACMRPCPPDAMPYMGSVPGYQGAYINAGHNCWGIAWAPACGKAIAELVLDGKSTSVDLSPFNPARFTPAAKRGDRGRKKQDESVGEQW